MVTSKSVFASLQKKAFPYRFVGTLSVDRICGGVPSDPKVAEGWLRKKMQLSDDAALQEELSKVVLERKMTQDQAVTAIASAKCLNGFKIDDEHGLYIEGRQLKAAIKEAASVAVAAGKIEMRNWGVTRKYLSGFLAEHVFVVQERLYLGRTEPDGRLQKFVQTFRGPAIQYEEYCGNVDIEFEVWSDWDFPAKDWANIWLCGEKQGIGASRSQGYGTYAVTRWDRLS